MRKKKNRSDTVTIVVVDKSHGRFREVHNLGTPSDAAEIDKLEMKAKKWISNNVGQPTLNFVAGRTPSSRVRDNQQHKGSPSGWGGQTAGASLFWHRF